MQEKHSTFAETHAKPRIVFCATHPSPHLPVQAFEFLRITAFARFTPASRSPGPASSEWKERMNNSSHTCEKVTEWRMVKVDKRQNNKGARPTEREDGKVRDQRIVVMLAQDEIAKMNELRGAVPASAFVRNILLENLKK
jgi:hypothetical protein